MGEGNATDDGVTGPQREVAAALAQAQADLASAQALSRQLSETAIAGLAARTQIESEQAVVATKSAHIQQAQEHADGVRANLDRALTAATGSATEAEGLRARAQTAADATTEIATAAGAKKATIEADAVASLAAKEAAEKTALALKALHTRAESAEAKVVAYEARLQELVDVAADQLARITELLPAAASAGLATAFDKRRMSFLKPSPD